LQDEPAIQIQVSTGLLLQLIQCTALLPPVDEHEDLQTIQVRMMACIPCMCAHRKACSYLRHVPLEKMLKHARMCAVCSGSVPLCVCV